MLLPERSIEYGLSILPKMTMVMELLRHKDYTIHELYATMDKYVFDVADFVDVLDALFLIGEINFDLDMWRIYSVKKNSVK